MQFNAKDDFVNDYQAELEQELEAEHKLEDEQDHDFDRADHKPTSDDEEQLQEEEEDAMAITKLSDPMIEYSPQDELDRIGNRDSYQAFRGY
jgi:hypothetical protein